MTMIMSAVMSMVRIRTRIRQSNCIFRFLVDKFFNASLTNAIALMLRHVAIS